VTTATGSFEIRAATPAELPAIRDLLDASLDCDPDARSLPELLAVGPHADPDLHLVALDGTEVVATGMASTRPTAANGLAGHLDLLAVSCSRARQGVGRALLAALEERLGSRGVSVVRAGGNAPCYAWPGVDVRYTGMVQLLSSAGYLRRDGDGGEAVNMSVRLAAGTPWLDTSSDEARLVAAGFVVQRLEPGDPDFARFMTGWSPHLAWEVEQSAQRRPSACHVARRTDTGDYVAFACHHSNRAGWFGPMGTDPSVRRFGIGSVLLRRCLADVAAEGRTEAQIAWVGPVGFYARGVDARISRVFWLFEKLL